MENKIHKNLKFAGLIAKKSEEIRPVVEQICEILKAQGIELLLEKDGAEFFGLKSHTLAEILKKTNFLISLGGDGTLRHAGADVCDDVRKCRVRNLARAPNTGDLVRILHLTERIEVQRRIEGNFAEPFAQQLPAIPIIFG